jgi:septum formation inhibitor MinC
MITGSTVLIANSMVSIADDMLLVADGSIIVAGKIRGFCREMLFGKVAGEFLL